MQVLLQSLVQLSLFILTASATFVQAEEYELTPVYAKLYSDVFPGLETIVKSQVKHASYNYSDDAFKKPALCSFLIWLDKQDPLVSQHCEMMETDLAQDSHCILGNDSTEQDQMAPKYLKGVYQSGNSLI